MPPDPLATNVFDGGARSGARLQGVALPGAHCKMLSSRSQPLLGVSLGAYDLGGEEDVDLGRIETGKSPKPHMLDSSNNRGWDAHAQNAHYA